jgi:RNA polymerase sigma-70 factor (ECF subfamily)
VEHGLVNLEISDAVLAARVQAGDRSAYDELVRRHMRQAFAIAYRIVRNQQDAEDTVQDAFIAALVAIQSFDTARPFAPWISRIVARKALNALEKRRVRNSDSLTHEMSDGRATPYDDAARTQVAVRVRAALTRLPPRQRTIVELVELEGTARLTPRTCSASHPQPRAGTCTRRATRCGRCLLRLWQNRWRQRQFRGFSFLTASERGFTPRSQRSQRLVVAFPPSSGTLKHVMFQCSGSERKRVGQRCDPPLRPWRERTKNSHEEQHTKASY